MFYMISLAKKCATMSTLNIQDTKKRINKNQPEKKKEAISRGVKVWTCIFKTRSKTKTMKKPTNYTSNITNFCNDNTLTGHYFWTFTIQNLHTVRLWFIYSAFYLHNLNSFQRFYVVWYIITTHGPSHNISK